MKSVDSAIDSVPPEPPSAGASLSRMRVFVCFASAVTLAFALPLWKAILFVASADYYSHVLLIPFISAYLIWQKRKDLPSDLHTSLIPGLFFSVIGLGVAAVAFAQSLANVADHHSAVIFSFLAIELAGAFFFLGSTFLRAITFPVVFLIFAVPLPRAVVEQIQIGLQHASAEAAYWMLNALSVPMLRNGTVFQLPGIPIRVAEECSGFNSSLVLFIVSLVAGHLFLRSTSRKVALALAVIPLAILRNGFRITVIAWLCVHVGPHMIKSRIHHDGGPVFFALSMIPFVGFIWILRRSESRKSSSPLPPSSSDTSQK